MSAHLNAACDHADCGDLEEAIRALEKAGQHGANATQLSKAKKYIAGICVED